MKLSKTLLSLGLAGLVAGFSAQAAEPASPQKDAPAGYGMPCHEGSGGHDRMHKRMQERHDAHHKALHDKLKLNADQEEAWKALTAAHQPPAEGMRPDWAELEKLSAPARMEKMMDQMKQRQEQMGARLQALKAFYAKLSPEQQKTFDQESLAPWKKAAERRNAKRGAKPVAK